MWLFIRFFPFMLSFCSLHQHTIVYLIELSQASVPCSLYPQLAGRLRTSPSVSLLAVISCDRPRTNVKLRSPRFEAPGTRVLGSGSARRLFCGSVDRPANHLQSGGYHCKHGLRTGHPGRGQVTAVRGPGGNHTPRGLCAHGGKAGR